MLNSDFSSKVLLAFMEKYNFVLDKLYRCFILHCLYNALSKEKGSRERIKIATVQINILIR